MRKVVGLLEEGTKMLMPESGKTGGWLGELLKTHDVFSKYELAETIEKFRTEMDALRDYSLQMSAIRKRIRIVGAEISSIAMDVTNKKGQAAKIEDFIDWERRLEEKLGDCHEIVRESHRANAFDNDNYIQRVMEREKSVTLWMAGRVLEITRELIDYIVVLLAEVAEKTDRAMDYYVEMIDGDEEVWGAFGEEMTERITAEEIAKKLLMLHEVVDAIEMAISV